DLLYRDAPGAAWKKLRHWGPEDQGSAVAFSADGKTLYIIGSHDADTSRLLALDPASGQETAVADDPPYDLGGPLVPPTKRTVQAVSFNRDKVTWKVLDPSIKDDFAALAKVRAGQFSVNSRDLADKTWLVSYVTDDGPVYYYAYDRGSKKAELL